ncbi:hypothetical protein ACFQRB_14140 [Halobaculum litoreum]|uniref:Uncharacterized protein n=1 Tax=Halobaculum litoreum TaxID=3031998 RepID=A0ABD5XQB2_9EURY
MDEPTRPNDRRRTGTAGEQDDTGTPSADDSWPGSLRPRAYLLFGVATLLGLAHHLDHVIRGNHVGWPITPEVNPFTYSLLIYPLVVGGSPSR